MSDASTRRPEEVAYTRVLLDPPFDIIRARFVRQKFVPHTHEEYAIGVVEEGVGRIEHAQGVDVHPAGAIVAIPPGLVHTGSAADDAEGWSYRMLYLPSVYLERAGTDAGFPDGARPWFGSIALNDDELADRIVSVHTTLERDCTSPAAHAASLHELLRDLARRHGEVRSDETPGDGTPSPGVQAVRTFIDEHFSRPITIDELARVADYSPFWLIRAFRRAYGMPPYTYVEQLRVEHARHLIEQGSTITDAALQAGFSDQSHLTRRFKRTLGITPGVIARRAKEDQAGAG